MFLLLRDCVLVTFTSSSEEESPRDSTSKTECLLWFNKPAPPGLSIDAPSLPEEPRLRDGSEVATNENTTFRSPADDEASPEACFISSYSPKEAGSA